MIGEVPAMRLARPTLAHKAAFVTYLADDFSRA